MKAGHTRHHGGPATRSILRVRYVGLAVAVFALVLPLSSQLVSASTLPAKGQIPLTGDAKLVCLSTQRCLAAGEVNPLTGGIALTTNAGTTWSLVAQDPVSELTGTAFTDLACNAQLCVAVGYQPDKATGPRGLILVSHDEGETWTQVDSGASELSGVSCTSPSICTAVGSVVPGGTKGQIAIETTDAGRTWVGSTVPSSIVSFLRVACTSHDVCLAIGQARQDGLPAGFALPAVFRSTNGGQTWTHQTIEVQHFGAITNIDCFRSGSCVVVGVMQGSEKAAALWTKTAGRKWTSAHIPSTVLELPDVACLSQSRCVAITEQVRQRELVGVPFYTNDFQRWTMGSVSPSTASIGAVSCITVDTCFASAIEPLVGTVLLHTNDGGKRWTN
jgi:photosystem II stability/assembly factor-like uncharacterized protein